MSLVPTEIIFEVTNLNSSGEGSLAWAISQVNSYTGDLRPVVQIDSSLAGQSIALSSAPTISKPCAVRGNGVALTGYAVKTTAAVEWHDITLTQITLSGAGSLSGENITLTSQRAVYLENWSSAADFSGIKTTAQDAYIGISGTLGDSTFTQLPDAVPGGYRVVFRVTVAAGKTVTLEEGVCWDITVGTFEVCGTFVVDNATVADALKSASLLSFMKVDGGKLQLTNANLNQFFYVYLYSGSTMEMTGGILDSRNYLEVQGGATATLTGVRVKDYINNSGSLTLEDCSINNYINSEGTLKLTDVNSTSYITAKGSSTLDGVTCTTLVVDSDADVSTGENGITLTETKAFELNNFAGNVGTLLNNLKWTVSAENAYIGISGTLGDCSFTALPDTLLGGYRVVNNVTVAAGKTVTLEEGVCWKFDYDKSLTINGTFVVNNATEADALVADNNSVYCYVDNGGKLQLTNANVKNFYGVYLRSGGSFEMTGGVLDTQNQLEVVSGSTAILTGVEVKDYILNSGSLVMENCTIQHYIDSTGTLSLKNVNSASNITAKGRTILDGVTCTGLVVDSDTAVSTGARGVNCTSACVIHLVDFSGNVDTLLNSFEWTAASENAYVGISGTLGDSTFTALPDTLSGGYRFMWNVTVASGKTVTLEEGVCWDLGEYDLNVSGTLEVDNERVADALKASSNSAYLQVKNGGKLLLTNANVNQLQYVSLSSGASMEMKGGTLDSRSYLEVRAGAIATLTGVTVNDYFENYGTLTLSNCTVNAGTYIYGGASANITGCALNGNLQISLGAKSIKITGNDLSKASLKLTDLTNGTGVVDLSGNYWGEGLTKEDIIAKISGYNENNVILDTWLVGQPEAHFKALRLVGDTFASAETRSMTIMFSHLVDESTISENVHLENLMGDVIEVSSWSQKNGELTLHFEALPADGKYHVVIGGGLKNEYGKSISLGEGAEDVRLGFMADIHSEAVTEVRLPDSLAPGYVDIMLNDDIASALQPSDWQLTAPDGSTVTVTHCELYTPRIVRLHVAGLPTEGEYALNLPAGLADAAGNKVSTESVNFTVESADNTVQSTNVRYEGVTNGSVSVNFSVSNKGNLDVTNAKVEIWLTKNGSVAADSVLLDIATIETLAAGGTIELTRNLLLSDVPGLEAGDYELVATVSGGKELTVLTDDNRGVIGSLAVSYPPSADLNISFENWEVDMSQALVPGANAKVHILMTNEGTETAFADVELVLGIIPAGGSAADMVQLASNEYGTMPFFPGVLLTVDLPFTVPADIKLDGDVQLVAVLKSDVYERPDNMANNTVISEPVQLEKLLGISASVDSISEGSSTKVVYTITRTGDCSKALTVNLSSEQAARLGLPQTVTIAAGQSSARVQAKVVNDKEYTGNVEATIGVSADGYLSASTGLTILEDENPSIGVSLIPADVTEGTDTVLQGTVSINTVSTQDIVVKLGSNYSGQIKAPSTVTIKAGESSASFEATVVDDNTAEIDKEVKITASATGFNSGSATVLVKDDDLPQVELVLSKEIVSESDGYYALTATLVRTGGSNEAITVKLKDVDGIGLILPSSVPMGAGVQSVKFTIGVVDDSLANGERTGKVRGTIIIDDCGCDASTSSNGGMFETTLTVQDNDSPALTLSLSKSVLREGGEEKAVLTIKSNYVSATDVVVTLSDGGMLNLPATIIIPAGSTSVTCEISALSDGVSDGTQYTTITGSADGFISGRAYMQVTDMDMPDLVVDSITMETAAVAKQTATVCIVLRNQGYAPMSKATPVEIRLSDGTVLGSVMVESGLEAGASTTITTEILLPERSGQYHLVAEVDKANSLAELDNDNNIKVGESILITSGYSVTADFSAEVLYSAGRVTITGEVSALLESMAVGGIPVSLGIYCNGVLLTSLSTVTAEDGTYAVEYEVPKGFAGEFSVRAGVFSEESDVLDVISVAGLKNTTATKELQWLIDQDGSMIGRITVTNIGSEVLRGVQLLPGELPDNLRINVLTDARDITAGGSATFEFEMIGGSPTIGNYYSVVPFMIVSQEGTSVDITGYSYVQKAKADVEISVRLLETTVNRTDVCYLEFTLTNTGAGDSGQINVTLPQLDWMQLYSGAVIENLAYGESATVVLKVDAAKVESLLTNVPYTGALAVNSENGGGGLVNFDITFVEKEKCSLSISAMDSFSLKLDDRSNIANASVRLYNAYTRELEASGYTDESGNIFFDNLEAGDYYLYIDADKCDRYKTNVSLRPGQDAVLEAYLENSTVDYVFNVTPSEIEDKYEITIESEFVTSVPRAVVVFDKNVYELPDMRPGDTVYFTMTVSNYGLVAADQFRLELPQGDNLKFTLVSDPIDRLDAQSSHEFWVKAEALPGGDVDYTEKSGNIIEDILCYLGKSYSFWVDCDGMGGWNFNFTTIQTNPEFCIPDAPPEPGPEKTPDKRPSKDGGGERTWQAYGPDFMLGWTGTSCTPCKAFLVNVVLKMKGYDGYSASSSFTDGVLSKYEVLSKLNTVKELVTDSSWMEIVSRQARECILSFKPSNKAAIEHSSSQAVGILEVVKPSRLEIQDDADGTKWVQAKIDLIEQLLENRKAVLVATLSTIAPFEALNTVMVDKMVDALSIDASESELDAVAKEYGEAYGEWINAILTKGLGSVNADLRSTEKMALSEADISQLISMHLGTLLGKDVIMAACEFWNRTVEYNSRGIYSTESLGKDDDPNFLSLEKLIELESYLENLERDAKSAGYASLSDFLEGQRQLISDQIVNESDSVCATVKLNFKQTATMSREAFDGYFSMTNGDMLQGVENVRLKVYVVDSNGVDVTEHFRITYEVLNGFAGMSGEDGAMVGGSLAAGESGEIAIQYIPDATVAADGSAEYQFGATLHFSNVGDEAVREIGISPVPLTVNPSPSLTLHYFLTEDVYSDDPFTAEIEAAMRSEIGLLIENKGLGVAKNFTMSEFTPEFVANEQGLALELQMLGSSINGGALVASGSNLNFGNIEGHSTTTAVWYFSTNLQGEFYVDKDSAKFTRIDSLGDTEYLAVDTDISLIESVTAHRLTRSMDVDGDGKTDFLVNDEADIADMAESLYLGKGGCESVNAVTGIYSTSGTLGMGNTTITLTMYMAQGWNYFRVNDPGQGNYRVESISMGGVKLSDSAIWQTDRVFDGRGMATYVDRLHWVCEATEDGYVDFTITYSSVDEKAPGVEAITGVEDKGTVREAVDSLTIIFDEAVNTSTFGLNNISLKLQQEEVDLTGLAWEWAEDGKSLTLTNLTKFTQMEGLYVLKVLNKGVEDVYGNAGDGSGRQLMWTYATTKVAVELVEGHTDRLLNKRVDNLTVIFTGAVASFGTEAITIVHTALDGTQTSISDLSGLTISAVAGSDNTKYLISGLSALQNSGDGTYSITVDSSKVLDAAGKAGTGSLPVDWNLHETPPSVVKHAFNEAEQIVQEIDSLTLQFSHAVSFIDLSKLTLTCNGEVYTSAALNYSVDAADASKVVVTGISQAAPAGKAAAVADGEWTLAMDLSGVEDIYGNVGSGVYSTNWDVDTIAPSALEGITINGKESRIVASTEFTIGATLPESGLNVRIYDRYIVGSEQDTLLWQGTVEGTELSQKLSLMNGGSRILTIVTTDAAGNSTTNTFNVFVDMVVLTVSTDLGDKYKELPESISITFNAATSDLPLSALGLTVDGRAISLDGATLTRVSDIQWELSGLSGISSSVGTYALSIDLSSVSKTLSGLQGQGTYTQSFFYDPVSEVRITGCEIDSSLELLSGISISFSSAINYAELLNAGLLQDAVRLVNQADGSVVELPASGFSYADNTLTWSGELSLDGGSYAVVVDSALLTAANGSPLVGNDSTANTAIVNFRGDALLLGTAGDSYSAPYAVDWNGDGRVDLLVGEKVGSEGKVRLYINNGNGGFANYTYLQSNGSDLSVSASGCQGIVVALQDLNGDNIADLVAGLSDGRVLSFAGSADGSFGSAVELFSSSVAGSRAYPTFYDWNHDGTMDIILGTGSGSLMVGLGTENAATGALSFATPTVVAGIEVPGRAAPVFADVNSDGVSDLILGDADGGLTLYYGSASGYYKVANWELPGVNWERSRVTVGDVNRDGATDLIVGGSTGDIYVVYGENAAGAWSQVFDVAAKPSVLSTSFSLDGTTATFGWQSKGANDDTVYLLEISSNPFFDENETLVLEVTGTGKVMEMEQGSYFWRVSVKGTDTPAREGAAFTVDTIAPNAPSDLAASVSNGTVTFTWASQSDPSGVIYELRYSTTSDFSSSRIYSRDTNSISISGLAAGDYYWQVRTVDLSGNISEWTTAEHAFTMEEIVAPEATANIHWAKGLATSEGQLVDGWWDADKTGVADSQLCWAAASANMLAWWQVQYGLADFSTSVPGTADAIFGTMSANWANVSGREEYGLVWWISGESESSSYNSYHANNFTGNGEDGCYFSHLYGVADTAALVKEVSLTGLTATQVATDWATIYENGGMLSLGIYRSLSSGTLTGGHTLTLWGFATDSAGRLASITVTDSDDGKDSALTLNLAYNVTRGYYQIAQSDSNLNGYMLGDYTALGAFTAYDSKNNDVTEAEVLTLPSPEDGATRVTTTNWVGAGDMLDYYVFAATGDGAYKVGIDSAALSDSLMISIGSMVDDKFVVQRSMKLNPNDSIYAFDRISLIEGQLCYILVENAEGAAGSEYSLTVTGDIMDKDVLITDNNTKETATELQLVSSTDAATNSWVGAGDARDHYRLEMTEAGKLTIKLSSLDKNASVTLYQDRGNGVYQRKYSATAKVVGGLLRTLSLSAGTYIVEVSTYDNGAGRYDTSYALELETQQGDETKRFVVMGDNPNITYNNTMSAATQLELVSDTDAAISSWVGTGDALDFYRLEMAETGRLSINLSELEKNTKISVYQDRGNGKYIRRLNAVANAESGLDQTLSLTAGTYFVEIASYDNGAGRYNSSYTLELETQEDGETKRFTIANA